MFNKLINQLLAIVKLPVPEPEPQPQPIPEFEPELETQLQTDYEIPIQNNENIEIGQIDINMNNLGGNEKNNNKTVKF